MRLRKYTLHLGMVLTVLALVGCGSSKSSQPTPDTAPIYTQAAQTVAVQLTGTSAAQTAAAPPPTATSMPTLAISTFTPVAPPPVFTLPPAGGGLTFPTPTLSLLPGLSTPTGVPCNNSIFISQFGAQDGSVFKPGQAFGVGWRIQNVGACNWVPGYALVQTGGNTNFGGDTFVIRIAQDAVASGAIVNISLNLVAPKKPGTYEAWYQLYTNLNVPFGTGMSIRIEVRK